MANETVPLRLSDEVIERLDRLKNAMEKRTSGAKISRAEVMRAAITKGLDHLEKKNEITK